MAMFAAVVIAGEVATKLLPARMLGGLARRGHVGS